MKIVLISDTHCQHEKLILPEGDMIIHGGDVSNSGYSEVMSFLQWFGNLNFRHKIFIAGNHDSSFEIYPSLSKTTYPDGIIYLQDSMVEINGLKIYGSPYTPEFYDWAFMKSRGEEIRKVWNLIPNNVDVLITHGPPFKILDLTDDGFNAGCEDLLEKVIEIKPRIHVFGHIHEAYGTMEVSGTRFFNASVLNQNYRMTNKPFEIEIE